jgi:Na+-driven multidrug efflux pump
VNLFRNLVFIVISAYLLAFVFGLGEVGVWWGIVLGNMMGGTFGFLWARFYVDRLIRLGEGEPATGPLPEAPHDSAAKPATDR